MVAATPTNVAPSVVTAPVPQRRVQVARTMTSPVPDTPPFDNAAELTEREYEIVRLIASGLSNSQISGTMFVGVNTVKSYIRSAYRKMQVHSRTQAVVWAFNHGLVAPVLTDTARRLQNL